MSAEVTITRYPAAGGSKIDGDPPDWASGRVSRDAVGRWWLPVDPGPQDQQLGTHHTSDECLALDRAKVCPVWVEQAGRPHCASGCTWAMCVLIGLATRRRLSNVALHASINSWG